MARKSIKSNYYLFDASEREVVIPGGIQREQLILITNVTDNKVIYNFSDPELTATEYHISTDIRNVVTTRVVLAYDTTSMSDTDKLQIVYDDFEETVQPSETYHDAVNKQRVAQPQSQIDTDFEYGTQDTKWESLSMINNNPFAYKSQNALDLSQISATQDSREILVDLDVNETLPSAGTAIYIQDTIFDGANGVFIIDKAGTADGLNANEFTYTAKYSYPSGNGTISDTSRSAVYTGIHYTGSDLGGTITLTAQGDNSILVECSEAHGLEVGNEFALVGSAGTNVNGSWTVARVTSPSDFYYYPGTAQPQGSVSSGTIKLYPRPQGTSIHRAFDGGVKFSTNSFSKNQQAIRQTKRYFRYQSGKGVAFSTGSILAPSIENIDQIISGDGSTPSNVVTVTAAVPHNLSVGTIVKVQNCNDNNFNGDYIVTEVVNAYKFKYTAASSTTEAIASGEYTVSPINSYGVNLEIGMMDQQNGLFFRYGNGNLSVVRRTSTFQLSGKVNVTNGDTVVSSYTGVNQESTRFAKQLKPGDYVVIRGSSYRVDGIVSDTQIVIFPDYRGPTAENVPVTKTVETVWSQNEWNLDRCDGTGKSGYTIDVTKMQMFYMDYSWYGAGFIRWGFRATDGNVIYVHKIPNNNQNTEAYMRSGNLPARYEVNTIPPAVNIYKDIATGTTSEIYTDKAPVDFPDSGTLRLKQTTAVSPNFDANIEYVNYSSKTIFQEDITRVESNNISVANTGGLTAGGIQPITFDRPFSNIVANKRYWVANKTATSFQITDVANSSTGIALVDDTTGSALSPLAVAESGKFNGLTREKSGATSPGLNFTLNDGESTGTVSSTTNLQVGQRLIGTGIDADTYVTEVVDSTTIKISKAVTQTDPLAVKFVPMGTGGAQTFTYSETQPISAELLQATSVPTISHWGSSVIMEGRYDDDRAYVYTVGTRRGAIIESGQTKALLAIRLAPSVDNGITGNFGTRELINRMQLVFRTAEISATGSLFVELVLNPGISTTLPWEPVGGTSLAQYCDIGSVQTGGKVTTELTGGEVIYGFYAENGVSAYSLETVKEISNSILGGGTDDYEQTVPPNPSGLFPDGPEVIGVRITNITGGKGNNDLAADIRLSWTEAQA